MFKKALVIFVFLLFLVPQNTLAFTDPHKYYDWNNYKSPKTLGVRTYAQEIATSEATQKQITKNLGAYDEYSQHDYVLGFVSDWTPENPFYFLKKAEEGLTLAFSFNAESRERNRLEFAGERLSEIETLIEQGKTGEVEELSGDYKNTVNQLSSNLVGIGNQDLLDKIDVECTKHTLVLEELAVEVPEIFEEVVDDALAASERAIDTVADNKGLPAVPQDVVHRLQSLEAQGILSDEEVTKLVGSETRKQAREEIRKYVKTRLFPEVDIKKFDETAMNSFPEQYYSILEIKKFKELKDLETEKPSDEVIEEIQDFAKEYEPGEVVPAELKRWWVPLVRLEELQNTIRPDLIDESLFRNRPEDAQKFQEVVERVKPTEEDVEYIDDLSERNPNVLNDPAYARIKALADKFGVSGSEKQDQERVRCRYMEHWIDVPFMPNGGYCMPNYEFPEVEGIEDEPCPPNYHRPGPGISCYPDDPDATISKKRASGDCPSGYAWVIDAFGGFCEPEFVSNGGAYPSPVYSPAYCPPGKIFRDGGCVEYTPPPSEGCAKGTFWNGDSCIVSGDLGQSYCSPPQSGCGTGEYGAGE